MQVTVREGQPTGYCGALLGEEERKGGRGLERGWKAVGGEGRGAVWDRK